MKNLQRRVATLTPSISVALILFTVGLTALLAYRAFDASRAQQRLTEQTLRDYAGFAAFQIKLAAFSRFSGQHRAGVDSVIRLINARGPKPALGAERAAALIEARRAMCRGCLEGVQFFYQVTFADSAVETTASPLATPANARRLRDTVIAQAAAVRDLPVPTAAAAAAPLGARITAQFFVPIFARLDDRPYLFAHALTVDSRNSPLVAYGYVLSAEEAVGTAVRWALGGQSILPRTLIRDMKLDSILAVRVTDGAGNLIYATPAPIDPRYAAIDSLESRLGGLHFEVAIQPAAANRLIIGGLPRSRLPEVLATAFVAVSLLGLLMFQFRRQEELGRLRDDFVSGVSHELRTPLAQIRLLAELLRMGKVPTDDKDRSLRIIDQEARRLSFLVDSILSFTPSQSSQLSPASTDIAAEIEETVGAFAPLAQKQSVHLATRLQRPLVAEVDRGALRQVLVNLLDNAVRYGPAGQTVTVTTASTGDDWTLEVADEGPGVPADERERVFAPYYRMKRDAGGPVGGTGIGLAVVRRLVEQHGGAVHVATDNGSPGARFRVVFPISARRAAAR